MIIAHMPKTQPKAAGMQEQKVPGNSDDGRDAKTSESQSPTKDQRIDCLEIKNTERNSLG